MRYYVITFWTAGCGIAWVAYRAASGRHPGLGDLIAAVSVITLLAASRDTWRRRCQLLRQQAGEPPSPPPPPPARIVRLHPPDGDPRNRPHP